MLDMQFVMGIGVADRFGREVVVCSNYSMLIMKLQWLVLQGFLFNTKSCRVLHSALFAEVVVC